MKTLTCYLFLLPSISCLGTNLKVENSLFYKTGEKTYMVLDISWENAFHVKEGETSYHDAAWLFFRWVNNDKEGYFPIHLKQEGHRQVPNGQEQAPLRFTPSQDGMGVFISLENPGEANISSRIIIELEPSDFEGINARKQQLIPYAIEMVYIPEGPVTLGSPNEIAYGALYQSDAKGEMKGLYQIKKEDQEIKVGAQNNHLFYQSQGGYEGDQKGVIPNEFPKGVRGFYVMKYEPTQGKYADFLNSLPQSMQETHDLTLEGGYYENRGNIKNMNGTFVATKPYQPCNYISWEDGIAFADWAGLRPMTEFEYTKACRGSNDPIENEFPWNTGEKVQVRRQVDWEGNLVYLGLDEADISSTNRDLYGVSLFRVHDLAGSLWERMISIGHEDGRNFKGSHGDGKLSDDGRATNADWPKGNEETGGYGFRGGGFYGYSREYHDFNPYSPIALRPYGGWAGGNRHHAYGIRFVRTAD